MLSIDRSEQGSRIVFDIISLIHQRRYEPGDRVPSERELAERFGVGRAVVREAMTMLESMRYIERKPGSGVFLSKQPDATSLEALVLFSDIGLPMDPKVNADCIEVRRLIEMQAIQIACERRTDRDLVRLKETLKTFERGEAFAKKASDYDYEFHMNIFRATQNNILVKVVTPFYIMSRARRERFFADEWRREASHAQHVSMVEAIEMRDLDAARNLMAAHIGRVDAYFNAGALRP